jgi:mono/diheme cytochrome c family protein
LLEIDDMTPHGWVVALITSAVALAGAPSAAAAQDPDPSTAAGKAAYERVCHACHGPEGRGDAAPRLVPFQLALEELMAIVRDGRGEMPPVSERRLTDEEVAAIAGYLKSLSVTPRAARASGPRVPRGVPADSPRRHTR